MRRLPPRVAVAIVVDVLHGLHAAHEAVGEGGDPLGIVHRDVSPHNVLVGVDGIARVLDFGVAKAVGRVQTTREGQLKGKLAYMAPEQIALADVDRRADVFAAGIVLWEALVGRQLFAYDGPARILDAILRDPIDAPSAVAATPEALDRVVLRALERDRERRYPTAAAMAEALEAALPVASRREVADALEARLGPRIERRRALLRRVEATTQAPLSVGTPKRADALDADATAPDALEPTKHQPGRRAGDGHPHAPDREPDALRRLGRAHRRRDGGRDLPGARRALRDEPAPTAATATSASVAPTASPSAPPSVVVALRACREAAGAPPSSSPSASAPRRTQATPRATGACRDPFRRDERGILIPRPECFR